MACPSVTTGAGFLVQTLSHLDCQAQTIGSFGYQALTAPGSPSQAVLLGLLTLFIALFGIRLMFGSGMGRSDLINATLKIGIVLTIALSWPAWKIIAYDTVIHGPAELADVMWPASDEAGRASIAERLQAVDTGIASLTYVGTGRLTGAPTGSGPTESFRSIALGDETALGWARPLYLASIIGALGTLRIAAGLLLAIAPIMAGLLLFNASRALFMGWIQGLFGTAIGSLGLTVLLNVQLAIMEPWLTDLGMRRAAGFSIPTAPTELLALVLGFSLAQIGLLALLTRVAFRHVGLIMRDVREWHIPSHPSLSFAEAPRASGRPILHDQSAIVRRSVEAVLRREAQSNGPLTRTTTIHTDGSGAPTSHARNTNTPIGNSLRRPAATSTPSQRQRDSRQ